MHDNGLQDLLDAQTERAEQAMQDLNYGQPAPSEISIELQKQDLPPAMVLAFKLQSPDLAFERLQRCEQRLDYTISRCLRELRKLRDDAEANAELPVSPFLAPPRDTGLRPVLEPQEQHETSGESMGQRPMSQGSAARDEANAQNEATVSEPTASAGLAEGKDTAKFSESHPRLADASREALRAEGPAPRHGSSPE